MCTVETTCRHDLSSRGVTHRFVTHRCHPHTCHPQVSPTDSHSEVSPIDLLPRNTDDKNNSIYNEMEGKLHKSGRRTDLSPTVSFTDFSPTDVTYRFDTQRCHPQICHPQVSSTDCHSEVSPTHLSPRGNKLCRIYKSGRRNKCFCICHPDDNCAELTNCAATDVCGRRKAAAAYGRSAD